MFKSDCYIMYCSSMWFDRDIYEDTTRRILNLSKYNNVSEMCKPQHSIFRFLSIVLGVEFKTLVTR